MKYTVPLAVWLRLSGLFSLSAQTTRPSAYQRSAFSEMDPAIHRKIMSLSEPAPPEIWEDHLILTYSQSPEPRFVGAVFRYEGYDRIHPFFLNNHGVFVLMHPLPPGRSEIVYRLVVDGVWLADPRGETIRDSANIALSLIAIRTREAVLEGPELQTDGRVRFTVRTGAAGQNVTLAGSFNNWDPFLTPLREIRPGSGLYEVVLPLPPGRHYYYFRVDGRRHVDVANWRQVRNNFGETVSFFDVP